MVGATGVASSQEAESSGETRRPGILKRLFPPRPVTEQDRQPAEPDKKGLGERFRGAKAAGGGEAKELVPYEIRFGGGTVDRSGRLYTTQRYQVTARVVNVADGEQVRGVAPPIRIRLVRDSEGPEGMATERVIFRRVECPGRYVWTVAEPHRGAYHLEAAALDGSGISGRSPRFEIHPPVINVTLPSRGMTIDHGQETSIQWESRNLAGNVRIELWESGDSGRRVRTLGENEENDGSWWGVLRRRVHDFFPQTYGRKIVVRSLEAPAVAGESGDFRIDTHD